MKRIFILLFVFLISGSVCFAQRVQNTINKNWPEGFVKTEIKSTADSSMQNAIFYKTTKPEPQPLIVSLHTWSGDYTQEDLLANEILLRDWNYIHPDFRGANNNQDACGSVKVIPDIVDAILYAIRHGNVDKNQVHIIGVSGGGYATLLAFMKINYPVRSFSAWCPISDLESWYWECRGRNLKYAGDLEQVTTGGYGFDAAVARKRSPLYMNFQPEKRSGAFLNIYAGIHDGYTGSVPITQSINMFNKLVDDMYPGQGKEKISDSLKLSLVTKQINPDAGPNFMLGGRNIYLIRELPNLNFNLFDGTHEMLVPQALSLIGTSQERKTKQLHILTIGDSNGTFPYSWPQQLKKLLPFSTIVNRSVSGNTIGFDNLGREDKNTLKNVNRYLDEAYTELGADQKFDYIIINLGTNDTKRIFEKRQDEVPENMKTLIETIRQYMGNHHKVSPEICIVTPSPMDEQKVNVKKYGGGDSRIQKNNQLFQKLAAAMHVSFIDSYPALKSGFSEKTTDGVHLHDKGQFQLASVIADWLRRN